MEEAAKKGTIKQFLLTDAGQREMWPVVKKALKENDALYFSHGFSIVYGDITGVVPPKNIDVILVAPKGSGTSVRRNFLDGSVSTAASQSPKTTQAKQQTAPKPWV